MSACGRLNTTPESREVKAVKGVKFAYRSTPQTRELLSTFRDMVNDALRICLAENVKGRLKLRGTERGRRGGAGSPYGRSASCNPTSTTRPGGRESRWSTSLPR